MAMSNSGGPGGPGQIRIANIEIRNKFQWRNEAIAQTRRIAFRTFQSSWLLDFALNATVDARTGLTRVRRFISFHPPCPAWKSILPPNASGWSFREKSRSLFRFSDSRYSDFGGTGVGKGGKIHRLCRLRRLFAGIVVGGKVGLMARFRIADKYGLVTLRGDRSPIVWAIARADEKETVHG